MIGNFGHPDDADPDPPDRAFAHDDGSIYGGVGFRKDSGVQALGV